uniref:phage major capsid protein n=2 Tax=Staphylococcus aureus TaxID=1280 RepID=UPI0020BE9281
LAAYGFDNIGKTRVKALYQNDGTKPLFNAVVEDYMREAFEKQFSAAGLIARQIPLDQLVGAYQVAVDHADDDVDFVKIGQGAPIPVSTIKLDTERAVKVFKRGRGIELTDEAKSMNFDMLAMQLRLRAKRLAKSEFDYVIDRLLNGSDTFDVAPSIGVKTSGTLKLADMWYAQNYMRTELGFEPKLAVMNMKTAEIWATLQETVHGLLFIQNLSNGSMPDVINASPVIAAGIPDDRIVLVDPDFALVEYVYRDLFTETARNPINQVEGSYTTKISEILPFEKNARLILKIDVART